MVLRTASRRGSVQHGGVLRLDGSTRLRIVGGCVRKGTGATSVVDSADVRRVQYGAILLFPGLGKVSIPYDAVSGGAVRHGLLCFVGAVDKYQTQTKSYN